MKYALKTPCVASVLRTLPLLSFAALAHPAAPSAYLDRKRTGPAPATSSPTLRPSAAGASPSGDFLWVPLVMALVYFDPINSPRQHQYAGPASPATYFILPFTTLSLGEFDC
jgi:hypothetical protein